MIPTIVVAPTVEPVSLIQAKSWCKVDGDDEDDTITGLIAAAREYCEWKKGYAFYEQTLEVALSGWCSRLRLPRATPLQSVVSVNYIDDNSVEQTLASSNYRLDTSGIPGSLIFVQDFSQPALDSYAPRPVVIRYVAGQPNVSPENPFPETVKAAVKLLVCHWYRNREAVIVGTSAAVASSAMELGVDALLGVNQQIFAY